MRKLTEAPQLTRDEYDALCGRLRGYALSDDVIADVELYRNYWQREAYTVGVTNAQMVMGVPIAELFADTYLNPFKFGP